MVYRITENSTGWQSLYTTSTVQNHPLGSRVMAMDPTLGAGEFIYLKGVVGTLAGLWVQYNADGYVTQLTAAGQIGPVAVAMSANVANQYGWYQISGLGSAGAVDVVDSGKVYLDTAFGFCRDAAVAGEKVFNATWASDDDTATLRATVALARPFLTNEST